MFVAPLRVGFGFAISSLFVVSLRSSAHAARQPKIDRIVKKRRTLTTLCLFSGDWFSSGLVEEASGIGYEYAVYFFFTRPQQHLVRAVFTHLISSDCPDEDQKVRTH
jgi:hypothetical protein